MKYCLKIINNVAYVTRKGFIHAVVDVSTPRVFLCNRQAQIVASNVDEVRSTVQQLSSCLHDLDREICKDMDANDPRRAVQLAIGKAKISVSTVTDDPRAFTRRLPKLLSEMGELLRKGDAICRQPDLYRPHLSGPVQFYRCGTEIPGMPVDEFFLSRKRIAIAMHHHKAEIGVALSSKRDPYGLCPDLQEKRREYFILDSKSKAWIAFRDLPNVAEGVLREIISAGLRKVSQLDQYQVQIQLTPLASNGYSSNVISFRRHGASLCHQQKSEPF